MLLLFYTARPFQWMSNLICYRYSWLFIKDLALKRLFTEWQDTNEGSMTTHWHLTIPILFLRIIKSPFLLTCLAWFTLKMTFLYFMMSSSFDCQESWLKVNIGWWVCLFSFFSSYTHMKLYYHYQTNVKTICIFINFA